MMNRRAHKLAEAFLRIVHKMIENQKKPRQYGIDDLLYPSEIHTIMMIGSHRDAHVSELARFLGVTRGAVSQMVAKLEDKGLIAKRTDLQNAKKVLLSLTTKGKVAYYAHEQYHEEADAPLIDYMANLTEEQYTFAVEFLGKMEEMVNRIK
jgi:DNA-binding MarR family transcriptional regulator